MGSLSPCAYLRTNRAILAAQWLMDDSGFCSLFRGSILGTNVVHAHLSGAPHTTSAAASRQEPVQTRPRAAAAASATTRSIAALASPAGATDRRQRGNTPKKKDRRQGPKNGKVGRRRVQVLNCFVHGPNSHTVDGRRAVGFEPSPFPARFPRTGRKYRVIRTSRWDLAR